MLVLLFLIVFNRADSFHPSSNPQPSTQSRLSSSLTGVYRIDIPASDKLYSVVSGASSTVPFGEQQRFFIDLAARLTPPDLLAIEQHGTRVSLGSSRAARMLFVADGVTRSTRAADGHIVRARFAVERERLVFSSTGRGEDNFTITFEPLENGRRLRVVRRLTADGLNQPVIIQTFYNKISDVARWELYGEALAADSSPTPDARPAAAPARMEPDAADTLRQSLTQWINATNQRDIEKQMAFYVPRLKAYYLTRNTSRQFVREEKTRVFATAQLIDIRAEEPEIIFLDGGDTAVMRYRKKYRVDNERQSRKGEVIQELRWQRTNEGWRIFSERDIRVLARG